jgi:3-phosphoshikimate 1-carboxyvinyltransferase
LEACDTLEPSDVFVPRDISAAAFFLVAASVIEGSDIVLENVGINPTRTGVLDALLAMGADIEIHPKQTVGVEPVADLRVRHRTLVGTTIAGDLALRCLDEIPVLAIAAAMAEGETEIRDAGELRVKESDRIARVCTGLRALGIEVDERTDGMTISGGRPTGPASIDASGDHRIAMAFAVVAHCVPGGVTIVGAESITSSYPDFFVHLEALQP